MAQASHPALETLAEDLILLSPTESGRIDAPLRLAHGLMGSELIRLVAGGYVEIVKGRIVRPAIPPMPNDPILREALSSTEGSPKAKRWVSKPRKQIKETYLRQLEARNVVRSESGKSLKVIPWTNWYPVDQQRHTVLRSRLDQIIAAPDPLGIEDRALAGLAYAIGLGDLFYAGREHKEQRERLQQIARPKKPRRFGRHRDEAPEPLGDATSASIEAADESLRAVQDAIQDAVDEAIGSAVDAAITAAVDGGHGGGHDGGGGGGHHG